MGHGLAVLDGAQGQAPSLQVHTLVIHLPGRRYHGERPGALRSYLIKIVAAGLGCWSEWGKKGGHSPSLKATCFPDSSEALVRSFWTKLVFGAG